jgi:GMP synthase (glutamine-hydrolysing)
MDQNVREFLGKIAEVPQNFTPNAFVEDMVAELKERFKTIKWSSDFLVDRL